MLSRRCKERRKRKETQPPFFLLYVSFYFLATGFVCVEKYELCWRLSLFFSNNSGTTEVGLGLDPSSLSVLIPRNLRKDRCIYISLELAQATVSNNYLFVYLSFDQPFLGFERLSFQFFFPFSFGFSIRVFSRENSNIPLSFTRLLQ